MNLYSGNQGSQLGRCAYDINVVANTPTSATLDITFRLALFCGVLLQDVYTNGGEHGLSHIDTMNITLQLQNLNTRLLSFARQTNNGVLNISNIAVLFGTNQQSIPPPTLQFSTYNIISSYFNLPAVVNYPLPYLDRYSIIAGLPRGSTATLSTPVITLNQVPAYCLLSVVYPESLYQSQAIDAGNGVVVHATQLTDAFCPISNINANVNSVNQLNNSTVETLWKMSVQNGCPKTFVEFSGLPIIKSLVGVGGTTYLYPSASPVKLNFDSDLIVKSPSSTTLSPGTNFKFNFSMTFQTTNTLPYSDQVAVYLVFVYPSVLSVSGVNNSSITNAPLSVEDNHYIAKEQPTGHRSSLNSHDLVGYGLFGKSHKVVSHPRMMNKFRKHRMLRQHMKDLMPAMASASGGASTGGARHRARSHSRKGHKASLMF